MIMSIRNLSQTMVMGEMSAKAILVALTRITDSSGGNLGLSGFLLL